MDEIVKKLAGLGLPGILLVIAITLAGGNSAAVIPLLAMLGGPLGIVGGLGVLGLSTIVGDAIAGYGIEAILKGIYTERSKSESVRFLLKEIKDLPLTEELKLKLKHHLSSGNSTDSQEVQPPRTVEIVDED